MAQKHGMNTVCSMNELPRHGDHGRRGETIAEAPTPGHLTDICRLTLSVWRSLVHAASLDVIDRLPE